MQELDAELVLDAHAEVGEGPTWDAATATLLWVDITRNEVHRLDPDSGDDRHHDVGQAVGAAVLRAAGGVALAVRDGFALYDEQGGFRLVAAVEADNPGNRMNDGKCDRAGRLWAGTMAYETRQGAGGLYRLDADYHVETVLDDVTLSNGLDWSPDDRQMYYIDSPTYAVDVFDYRADDGALRNRRRLIDIPEQAGLPDGMTVDAQGCLWVALFGGSAVHRYTPDGRLDRIVRLPVTQVTSCCFGGPDLDQLFITSAANNLSDAQLAQQPHAGGVFLCRPGCVGLPARTFAG